MLRLRCCQFRLFQLYEIENDTTATQGLPTTFDTKHMYQTYRRINIPNCFLGYFYWVLTILTVVLVFPFVMQYPACLHMLKIQPRVSFFIETVEPLGTEGRSEVTDSMRDDLDAKLLRHWEQCRSRTAPECNEASALNEAMEHTCLVRNVTNCEYWDWMEIGETMHTQFFLTTSVHDHVEHRVKQTWQDAGRAAMWRHNASFDDDFLTIDPGHVDVAVEMTAVQSLESNLAFHFPTVDGYWLPEEQCRLLRTGRQKLSSLFDSVADGKIRRDKQGRALVNAMELAYYSGRIPQRHGAIPPDLRLCGSKYDVTVFMTNLLGAEHSRRARPEVVGFGQSADVYDARATLDAAMNQVKDALRNYGLLEGDPIFFFCVEETVKTNRQSFTNDDATYSRRAVPYNDSEREYRLIRTQYGIHGSFSVHADLGTMTALSVLQFVGANLAFLSVPWAIAELILTINPMIAPRRLNWGLNTWFREFLLDA